MYNFSVLSKLDEIDLEAGLRNSGGTKEFLDGLTRFTENSGSFLVGFNPTVVVYSDENSADFLKSLAEVRFALESLGMTARASELEYLERAVEKRDPAILADELSVFSARMKGITEHILSARTEGDAATTPKTCEKIILAVDDRPEILETIEAILENEFKIVCATSGKEALAALENFRPDLFILDIEMPDMNGYELKREIRKNKRFKNSPIIFLTGKSSRDDVLMAKSQGVKDYILKPVDGPKLLSKILKYLS